MASGDRIQIADQKTSELINSKVDGITGYIGEDISEITGEKTGESSTRINIASQNTSDEIINKLNNLSKLTDKRNMTVVGAYNASEADDIGVEAHADGGDCLTGHTRPRASGYMTSDTLITTWIQGLTADKVQAGVTFGSALTLNGTYTSDATAISGHILKDYTAYSKGKKIAGDMPDNGAVNNVLSANGSVYTVPKGYHNGSGKVTASISNLTAANIKGGVNVGGIVGTAPVPSGTAGAAQVLTGYSFSNASGVGISGSMANRGNVTQNLATNGASYTIPVGYHAGGGKITANITNLSAGNIKSGVSVGGIAGTFTNDATATAAQIVSGYTAYVNGSKVTGAAKEAKSRTLTITTIQDFTTHDFYYYDNTGRHILKINPGSTSTTIYGDTLIIIGITTRYSTQLLYLYKEEIPSGVEILTPKPSVYSGNGREYYSLWNENLIRNNYIVWFHFAEGTTSISLIPHGDYK